jgi:hypothetical protein
MSGFLLDTNIPSEIMKIRPQPKVQHWLEEVEDEHLFFSMISLAEIFNGISYLPHNPRCAQLEECVETVLRPWFAGRLLPVMAIIFLLCLLPPVSGQEKAKLDANDPAAKNEDKRVLGVIPNYRTAEPTKDYHPISAQYKLTIAAKDSFDYPLVGLGAAFAGLYQLENSHPQFGQGTVGYFRRLGTSYADQAIGNMMAEGFLPALLKEDPRYFRMAVGTKKTRAFYAVSRILPRPRAASITQRSLEMVWLARSGCLITRITGT